MTEDLSKSATMDLAVSAVPHDQVERLEARARRSGVSRDEYVRRLIERDLDAPTMDEIFAPFRDAVEASGISDAELTALFEDARNEVWEEWKRTGKA